ncbi:MAG: pilus assembly protein, partial [bacterium]
SPDYYGTVCPGSTSVSACATDILNFVLDPDSSTDNWKLGAIFHSTPILIGPPPFPYPSSSYQSFKQEYAVTNPRNEVLYAGANDGMLHAFNAGSWDTATNSYTYGTGAEVFGYIPTNLLPKITSWYDSSIGVGTTLNFPEFVDSTPAASDVFFSNIFNGTVNFVDSSNYPLNQSSLQNSWHSVLMGGERNGGTYYYALGVTNPLSSSYPDPLWNFTDSSMGNTWSKPNIYYVCLPNPDYAANNGESGVCGNNPDPVSPLLPPQYIKTYAAFIGGGYSSNNSLGNALYSLYVEPNPVNTGTSAAPNYTDEQILWEFNSSNDVNMKYSIPSAVTPVLSQNFRMEGFYAGDLGGQMWSANIPDGLPPYAASGKSNWDACRLFDSNVPAANPLNIFFSPATALDTVGNLWVFFGTGNRENLNEVITSRNNEFIAINTTPLGGQLTCPASGPINESDLVNQTGVSGSTTNLTAVNSADGWYITLSPGEKVTSAPTVYDGIVYFTTFTPSSVTNACGYGTSNLYAVSYLNGGGTILTSTSGTITIINNATASSGAAQSTVIGSGVASAPVISNNYLGITTSTGQVISRQIPALPSKVTPTSWFQEP